MKYFIWGEDSQITLPHGGSGELEFGGFIAEGKARYEAADRELEGQRVSLNNFLRSCKKEKAILVLFFKSAWAYKYLYQKIGVLKCHFDFEIMDVYEFCINFDYSIMYDTLSDTRRDVIHSEKIWLEIVDGMADEFSKKSLLAYMDSLRYKNSKFLIPYIQPNDLEAFNRHSTHFSFVPNDNEIFIDVGAYDGDTVLKFINSTPDGSFKKIYAFEPNPALFPRLKEKTQWIPNLEVYQIALSDRDATLDFVKQEMGSRLASAGVNYSQEVVSVEAKN